MRRYEITLVKCINNQAVTLSMKPNFLHHYADMRMLPADEAVAEIPTEEEEGSYDQAEKDGEKRFGQEVEQGGQENDDVGEEETGGFQTNGDTEAGLVIPRIGRKLLSRRHTLTGKDLIVCHMNHNPMQR